MPANMEEKKEDNNTDAIMTGSNYSKIKASTILNKELCLEMMQTSIDWSLSNGLTMGSQKIDNAFIHAPHTLLPILLSLSDHQKLSNISLIFHKLIDSLSRDDKFLISCIKQTAESDKDFTGKMLSLYQKQINDKKNNLNQKYQLGIFRSDYMKNSINDKKWGQIEFNTIAASFGALSDLVFNLHKLLLSRFMNIDNVPTSNINTKYNDNDSKLYRPCCDTTKSISKALGTAAKLVHPDNPIVLMLIQPGMFVHILLLQI